MYEQRPRFILTTDTYAALGAVVIERGRYIGYRTDGSTMFDRKDFDGMLSATKKAGVTVVAAGYYGVPAMTREAEDGMSAPARMRQSWLDRIFGRLSSGYPSAAATFDWSDKHMIDLPSYFDIPDDEYEQMVARAEAERPGSTTRTPEQVAEFRARCAALVLA